MGIFSRGHRAHALLALLGGTLVACGLPPLSWWPLMLVGIACYIVASEHGDSRLRIQFVIGVLFAWGWLAPAMGWMWQLVPGGFVIAPLLFALLHGLAAVVASQLGRRTHHDEHSRQSTLTSRIIIRSALHVLVESLRFVTPFGGVPLAGLALGVADTRVAQLVRLVGPLGLAFWLFVLAGVLAELWLRRSQFGWLARRNSLVVLMLLVGAQVLGTLAPHGNDTGQTLRIAVVQGGGPQAVLAIDSNPAEVIERHLQATKLLQPEDDIDLVIWPENAIDVSDFRTSAIRDAIIAEARRIDAPFAVGVTESIGNGFTNAQLIVDQDGVEVSRYDKVRRVPYGEYIPLRSLLKTLGAPVDRIPRDAVAGTRPALLRLPDGEPIAVAISWEVFFSGRVNDGIAAGGQLVINPTNGSSYTGEILQRQQVATSQLRAIESARYVAQVATTGYSLIVDDDGRVRQRIPIGKQAVIFQDVPLRTGRTMYSHLGDAPIAALLFVVIGFLVWRGRRDK